MHIFVHVNAQLLAILITYYVGIKIEKDPNPGAWYCKELALLALVTISILIHLLVRLLMIAFTL